MPSVQVKVAGVTATLYGISNVQRELKRHAQSVSQLDLQDDKFDAEYAQRVEAGLKLIRHDMQGAAGARTERDAPTHASTHGLLTTAENQAVLMAMSWEPPTRPEMYYAIYKLHISESGAPGVDGVMAWMLLWATETTIDVLVQLFTAILRW